VLLMALSVVAVISARVLKRHLSEYE
jgi:hypothetical protein